MRNLKEEEEELHGQHSSYVNCIFIANLQFVQLATIQALMQCAILYSYVKERAGPLKFGVDTVEEAVKTVVAPIYQRFHLVPVELLKYADRKVAELDRRVPSNVKTVSFQACSVVSEIRRDGVSAFAKTAAEQCAVSAWRKLNQLPLIAHVVNALLHKKYRYSACADN